MAVYFVRPTNGSDSNDGLDFHGFGLATATYDDTGNGEGEKHLSSTSAFSSYTWNSGDTIYLSGGAGITAGLYEIASKVDADAILLVTSAGSDSTSDVTSSSGSFATFQKACDTVAIPTEHSEIRCVVEATETHSVAIDLDIIDGTTTYPVQIHAASSTTGEIIQESTKYTIQASASMTRQLFCGSSKGRYLHFHDMIFDGNSNITTASVDASNTTGGASNRLVRCVWKNGRVVRWRGSQWAMVDCEVYGGTGTGVRMDNGQNVVMNTRIHDNTGIGISMDSNSNTVTNCEIYDNGGDGLLVGGGANVVTHNAIYGNGGDGIENSNNTTGAVPQVFRHNTIAKNGGYGIHFSTALAADIGFAYSGMIDFNHYWSNTSGAAKYNGSSGVSEANINTSSFGTNNQTGDPGYTSETDGSEDFTPTADTSNLYGTGSVSDGVTGGMIGPIVPDAGGGGGGATIIGSPIIRGIK